MTSRHGATHPTSKSLNFDACLLVVVTCAIAMQVATRLMPSLGVAASWLSCVVVVFLFEWYNVHFASMTRMRRACFDVANVLETYQPRARTHGHLFNPDPPTPCVTIADGTEEHETPKEKNAFTNARDSHYENMYQKAVQMAKEMEAIEKAAGNETMDSGQENVKLTPAEPEKDKKAHDEKKKRDAEKYKAESSKPLNC